MFAHIPDYFSRKNIYNLLYQSTFTQEMDENIHFLIYLPKWNLIFSQFCQSKSNNALY